MCVVGWYSLSSIPSKSRKLQKICGQVGWNTRDSQDFATTQTTNILLQGRGIQARQLTKRARMTMAHPGRWKPERGRVECPLPSVSLMTREMLAQWSAFTSRRWLSLMMYFFSLTAALQGAEVDQRWAISGDFFIPRSAANSGAKPTLSVLEKVYAKCPHVNGPMRSSWEVQQPKL